jgi:hypothetical protein
MIEHRVEIAHDVALVVNTWESFPTTVELEYVEHSPDAWYSDTNTSVDIDRETAERIIAALKAAFDI